MAEPHLESLPQGLAERVGFVNSVGADFQGNPESVAPAISGRNFP
jgi:hypothetical protein